MTSKERGLEIALGNLLRIGVTFAGALVAAGGALYLARHGLEPVSYAQFRGEPEGYRTLRGMLGEIAEGRGRGLIQLGLVALIATPVARVAFSAFAFARQRDRVYVGLTLAVLALLLYGLAGQ